jgi:hypothetical protein
MWIDHAQNAAIEEVAKRLGIHPRRSNSLSPCPCCGAETRSSSDKRGPIGLTRDAKGWRCHVCGSGGDVVDLVSHCLKQARLRNLNKDDQREIRQWFESELNGIPKGPPRTVIPKTKQRSRPPALEVADLWKASRKLNELRNTRSDRLVVEFLNERDFDIDLLIQSRIVRMLPDRNEYQWPSWWPRTWSPIYRLVVPAFEPNGRLASIHARAVGTKPVKPKSRWPKGFEAGGLFMANAEGVALLRGNPSKSLEGLLICEGITDMLRASSSVIREKLNFAVLAGTSGSFRDMAKVDIPKNLRVFVATDPDEQGEQYAGLIHKSLAPHPVYRLNLAGLE